MNIAGREIARDHPPYVVAEISGEHLGEIELAVALIKCAKDAGADAVKLQCFDPDRLAELRGGKDKVLAGGLWKGWKLGDLYRKTHTPRRWFPNLRAVAEDLGITLFTSVFDPDDVEFAVKVGCPALKIAAAESADVPLVKAAKATGLPLIVSVNGPDTWIASDADAVLYCPPGYPCPLEKMELWRLSWTTHVIVGLSDHSIGTVAATVAVGLGAAIIEKHITLSRKAGGLDAAFSLEPDEFATLVRNVKDAWIARGN